MRMYNNIETIKESLKNNPVIETVTGYDMSKEIAFFRASVKSNWEDLPKAIFLVRWWRGSPKGYNGYFVGGSYMSPSIADEITIYEDGEIKFTTNHHEVFTTHCNELHRGNDYDILVKEMKL